MELTLAKIEISERARKMFDEGATSSRVAIALRMTGAEALAMKKAWADEKAPPKSAKVQPGTPETDADPRNPNVKKSAPKSSKAKG